jgi:hypothetical protein
MKLSSIEIRIQLIRMGKTSADLAREWDVPQENISRVIHRTPGFVFPEIREKLAELLRVPVSAIGREADRQIEAKAA